MFRASSAHLQEVSDVNCTCMQPLVFSFSAGDQNEIVQKQCGHLVQQNMQVFFLIHGSVHHD